MIDNYRRILVTALLLVPVLGCSQPKNRDEDSFQGVVEFEEVNLSFELAGRVKQIWVKEGDTLSAGARVAELDDELERAARAVNLSQAEVAASEVAVTQAHARPEEIASAAARVRAAIAAEELLARNLERQRALLERGAVARASVDDLESQHAEAVAQRQSIEHQLASLERGARHVEVSAAEKKAEAARASVRLDDVRLEHHELEARAAGTVLDVHVDPGEVVAAGAPVITYADTHRPYADVFVPQANLTGIRLGASARARIDADPREFVGHVEHIASRTEFTPRYLFSRRERPNLVVRVRVRFEDPGARPLYAGVPVFVDVDRAR